MAKSLSHKSNATSGAITVNTSVSNDSEKTGKTEDVEVSTPEPVLSPLQLMEKISPNVKILSDEELDNSYNPILADVRPDTIISDNNEIYNSFEVPVAPVVNKVAIKKINKFAFRLGLEKTKGSPKLMPGTAHRLQVDKKGDKFITGLEDVPDVRKRLEKTLGVSLSPTSSFWIEFIIELTDKEHGHLLNFDDPRFGPTNELTYYALKASSIVANGLHEYTTGVKPFAEWYIENKDAEAESLQKEIDIEVEASRLYSSLSDSKITNIGKLMQAPVWGYTDKAGAVEVWKFIKGSHMNAKRFVQLAKMQDTEFAVRVMIEDAIKANVIRRNKALDYTFANEVLGNSIDTIVSKLAQPSGSALRVSINNMLKAKTH